MARRPKGLFTTIREWWRSKYPTAEGDADGAGDEAGAADAVGGLAASKEVGVELPPFEGTLSVDANGEMFAFEVIPHFRWTNIGMTSEQLRERATAHQDTARGKLLRRAWPIARGFDPSDAEGAERAVNKALREGWCYDDEKGMVRCHPSVRVRVDPALRKHLLPFHLTELRLKEEHRLGHLRAGQVKTRTERWLQIIKELEQLGNLGATERRLLVPFAAALADQDFAKVMELLEGTRRSGTMMLAQVLDQATKNSEQVGLFEYANAYDKALSAFCRQMGLSPFSWVDGAVAAESEELSS